MRDNNFIYGELQESSPPLLYKNKDINTIKIKLLKFLNDYDIFDVDFITYDDVEDNLATPKARQDLIRYLDLVKQAEDDNYEFIEKINEIIKDIESFDSERNYYE